MSDWRSRVRSQIILVAPDGTRFAANWQGNDVEAGKRIGQFDYPLVDGTSTQDLGAKGLMWPLTLQFEGDDHDVQALAFLRALSQRGTWTVSHPVYGGLTLQPISATLSADPTGSGNISKVESSWIEPAVTDISVSAAELGAQITAEVDAVNAEASDQFVGACKISDPEAAAAAATAGTQGLSSFQASGLYTLVKGAADIQAAVTSAYSRAQAALTGTTIDLIGAAAQIQSLVELPGLIVADLSAKIAAFIDFAGRLNVTPGSDANAVNSAVIVELYFSAITGGAALSVATSAPSTREQAVQAIGDINALFAAILAALDAAQEASAVNPAIAQYFSNGINFAGLARLVGMTTAYLLRLIFDLKVVKRFVLDRPRAPIEVTISEYGELGDGDALLDLFIASNGLRGNDILLIPAGREVAVYV